MMSNTLFTVYFFVASLATNCYNCCLGATVNMNPVHHFHSGEAEVTVDVDTSQQLSEVEDHFISYTIDCGEFDESFQNLSFSSPRLHTLLKALSPSILRIGGSGADWLFFDKPLSVLRGVGLRPVPSLATKKEMRQLVELTKSTGNRLLFDLNLQFRYGQQWDPSNAIELMQFFSDLGYGDNIDWELGNEPQFNSAIGQLVLSAEQIANDFVVFDRVVRSFPAFNTSRLVGPDIVGYTGNEEGFKIIQAVVNQSGSFLHAATFHHYYFRGDTASYEEYLNPKYFSVLPSVIDLVQASITKSKFPATRMWLGETSDAWHSGTQNVSDRFVSGFLWLDKLGVSAERGIGVVMRQTLYGYNYALLDIDMNPNPDYWVYAIHRALVGKTVLRVTTSGAPMTTRVYVQCTATRSGIYSRGAVTAFALNSSPTTYSKFVFANKSLRNQPVDAYVLSPVGDVLSKRLLLNGQQLLVMPSDTEMPVYKPLHLSPGSDILLPPLTLGFFVFPHANVSICL